MTRILVCSIAFFVLAIGIAHAIPARPLYEPLIATAPPAMAVNLNGTSWSGKYNAVNRIFVFEADGTLSYRTASKAGKTKEYKNRGEWKLEGNSLYFQYYMSPKTMLMEFRGTIQDAYTVVGEATYPNLKIGNQQQTLKRLDGPK